MTCATAAEVLRDLGGDECQSLSAAPLERFVDEAVMNALAAEAAALSLEAQAQVEADRAGQHGQWQLRLASADRDVQYAERDWRAVDPENRLVAQTLEEAWEAALAVRERLQEQYRRFCARTPRELSGQEREALLHAVNGIAALWVSGRLSKPEKAEILRLMIAQVTVRVIGTSERVATELLWHGGSQVTTEIQRPVRNLEQLSYWRHFASASGRSSKKDKRERKSWKSSTAKAGGRRVGQRLPREPFKPSSGISVPALPGTATGHRSRTGHRTSG